MATLDNVQRSQGTVMATDIVWPVAVDDVPTVSLMSFEVEGDPTGNYPTFIPTPPGMPNLNHTRLVQISDPTTGRIEWIHYDYIDTSKGPGFFIDSNRFRFDPAKRDNGSRGRQRTAFAASDIPGGQLMTFPAQSRVIPVQTSLGTSHVLATGDVVTITPKAPGTGPNGRPWQACIRFAATDGFHPSAGTMPPADNSWDTVNNFFAFTEALPEEWPDDSFELIGWPGWSGNDIGPGGPAISSRNNQLLPYFTMPLAAAFSPGYSLGGNAQIWLGGDDTRHAFLQFPNNQPFDGVVDAVFAGAQPGGTSTASRQFAEDNLILRLGTGNGPELTSAQQWLDGAAQLATGVVVQCTNPIFEHDLGLVLIGGEVFAYERQHISSNWNATQRTAKLIGRGLLGSKPVIHRGPEPVLILPIGPVGRLVQPLNNTMTGEQEIFISTQSQKNPGANAVLNAPAVLLCAPDGQQMELIGMPERCVAPWLRGMYNTTLPQGSWPGSASGSGAPSDTLVIGWWPRYPSAFPNQQSPVWTALSPDQRSAMLRCRMYSWMGFPIRFHDTWLTGGSGLVDLALIDDGAGTFNVTAAALDQGFDWNGAIASGFTLTSGGNSQDASAIFSRFQQKAVDGVEVRVRWDYRSPPANIRQLGANGATAFLDAVATAGNTAPMLGKTRLRARAPAKILQVEEAR
jgi:hypothetical protein